MTTSMSLFPHFLFFLVYIYFLTPLLCAQYLGSLYTVSFKNLI